MSFQGVKNPFNILVIVASLGYFVDIYDLVLFNVVKRESLMTILGPNSPDLKSNGVFLFNMQMLGMLIGGLLWGVYGDKKGRVSVLFGSILLYSAANIANAYVNDIAWYAIIRVIAGIGLAGELGAGITLVSETMSKQHRGYGTMIIVAFGALGAVLASQVAANGQVISDFLNGLTGQHYANWQIAYLIGGVLGLLLLVLRMGAFESGMFNNIEKDDSIEKGNFLALFKTKELRKRYLNCIAIGLPIWYVIGVLISLSQEYFSKDLNLIGQVNNGTAIMYAYIGLSVGDVISGLLSQWLKSRKKVVFIYLIANLVLSIWYLFFSKGLTVEMFYLICFLLGAATGYWAIFVTIASEQFGTNIRSTATNTAPNFVRGAVIPITLGFTYLVSLTSNNLLSAAVIGIICIVLAWKGVSSIEETFGKDLNYIED